MMNEIIVICIDCMMFGVGGGSNDFGRWYLLWLKGLYMCFSVDLYLRDETIVALKILSFIIPSNIYTNHKYCLSSILELLTAPITFFTARVSKMGPLICSSRNSCTGSLVHFSSDYANTEDLISFRFFTLNGCK